MRSKIGYHARSHLRGGSDPLPAFLTGITAQTADWGYIGRDGTGTTAVTSGAVNALTTDMQHNRIFEQHGSATCDIVSTPSRIQVFLAGLWIVQTFFIDADSGGADYGLTTGYWVNAAAAGVAATGASRRIINGGAITTSLNFLQLNSSDFITHAIGQNSGGTLTKSYLAGLVVARVPGQFTGFTT